MKKQTDEWRKRFEAAYDAFLNGLADVGYLMRELEEDMSDRRAIVRVFADVLKEAVNLAAFVGCLSPTVIGALTDIENALAASRTDQERKAGLS